MGLLIGIGNISPSYYSGYNVVNTLTDIPVDRQLVVASISESATLSLAEDMTDGRELLVIINNTSDSAITVTLPDSSTLEIAGGSHSEVSIIYAAGVYYFKSSAADKSTDSSGSADVNTAKITLVNGDYTATIELDENGYVHVDKGLYSDVALSVGGSDNS